MTELLNQNPDLAGGKDMEYVFFLKLNVLFNLVHLAFDWKTSSFYC